MKKLLVPTALLMLLLAGCGYFSQFDNFDHSRNLRIGMTKDQVREVMGEPLDAPFAKPDVWFYYIETRWHDGQSTIDECLPVVFKRGKVTGWGNDYYNRQRLVHEEYQRPTIEGVK